MTGQTFARSFVIFSDQLKKTFISPFTFIEYEFCT